MRCELVADMVTLLNRDHYKSLLLLMVEVVVMVVVVVAVVMLLLLCKLVAVDDMVVPSGRPSLNRDHHQSVPTNSPIFANLMNHRQFQACLFLFFLHYLPPSPPTHYSSEICEKFQQRFLRRNSCQYFKTRQKEYCFIDDVRICKTN